MVDPPIQLQTMNASGLVLLWFFSLTLLELFYIILKHTGNGCPILSSVHLQKFLIFVMERLSVVFSFPFPATFSFIIINLA